MKTLRCALVVSLLTMAACSSPSAPPDAADVAPADALDAAPADAPDDAAPADVPGDAAPTPVTITTRSGPVVGRDYGDVQAFLGIPYAESPAGPRRWRAPEPRAAWTAPLDASAASLPCPQVPNADGSVPEATEDCLRVNVWTPAHAAGAALPVMVFIHGGGFTAGQGALPLYDGRALARRGPAVVVTINYRLGPLGFLALPQLIAEDAAHHSAGNYGFLDQLAALAWVRDHVAAFGGAPGNVTIFGESAGAISVSGLLVSPLARGLFHRAIAESGNAVFIYQPLTDTPGARYESAVALGQRFAAALHCDAAPDVLACLRAVPAADVTAAAPAPLDHLDGDRAHYMPTVDGYVFPEVPWAAVRAGHVNVVPTITGINQDEGTGFALLAPVQTQAEYETRIRSLVPAHVTDAVALYPAGSYPTVNDAFAAFLGDTVFACPARAQARRLAAAGVPSYLYLFTRVNNFGRISGLGVFHGAELPYVFGNFAAPFQSSSADRAVANVTMDYWTRFATTGDPGGAGAVAWSPVTAAAEPYLEIGDAPSVRTALRAARCDVLERWIDER